MTRFFVFRRLSAVLLAVLLLASLFLPVFASEDNGDLIVYRTATGYAYHRSSCGHLRSKIEITLREAVKLGLFPCEHCNPPIYTGPKIESSAPRPSSSESRSSSSESSIGSGTKSTVRTSTKEKSTVSKTVDRIGNWIVFIIVGGFVCYYLFAWIYGLISDRRVYTPDGKRVKRKDRRR